MPVLEHLPVDHRMNGVYRIAGGVAGAGLVLYGILGFLLVDDTGFFDRKGGELFGMRTNGALNTISILVGLLLLAAAFAGRNLSSTANTLVGCLFLASGLYHLAVLRTDANIFAFTMTNVIFSFVTGLVLLACGLYGRVSGGVPYGDAMPPRSEGVPRP